MFTLFLWTKPAILFQTKLFFYWTVTGGIQGVHRNEMPSCDSVMVKMSDFFLEDSWYSPFTVQSENKFFRKEIDGLVHKTKGNNCIYFYWNRAGGNMIKHFGKGTVYRMKNLLGHESVRNKHAVHKTLAIDSSLSNMFFQLFPALISIKMNRIIPLGLVNKTVSFFSKKNICWLNGDRKMSGVFKRKKSAILSTAPVTWHTITDCICLYPWKHRSVFLFIINIKK